ncbi:MAG: hypothetical protein OdinLCB4_002610 [Candidatus Odinarchaeum yellowstonii]|uniref:Uncharacterized protein n=1 Tax=Odinarchaeota yellowstonii (strain LCB_4) TaxID=1841599 RepID=A0AAF0ID87_ODILC|nr:MAG: hypothetical protein OdinLCB4_002610 [Candidatus Odinarchaeum yellowstonii]
MYGVSDIYYAAEEYDFQFSLVEFLFDTYGERRAVKILSNLKKPVERYALRVNTLKTTAGEVKDKLKAQDVEVLEDETFNDVIYIKVRGPNPIRVSNKIIVADKFRR